MRVAHGWGVRRLRAVGEALVSLGICSITSPFLGETLVYVFLSRCFSKFFRSCLTFPNNTRACHTTGANVVLNSSLAKLIELSQRGSPRIERRLFTT